MVAERHQWWVRWRGFRTFDEQRVGQEFALTPEAEARWEPFRLIGLTRLHGESTGIGIMGLPEPFPQVIPPRIRPGGQVEVPDRVLWGPVGLDVRPEEQREWIVLPFQGPRVQDHKRVNGTGWVPVWGPDSDLSGFEDPERRWGGGRGGCVWAG